jgi:hypothetical protein
MSNLSNLDKAGGGAEAGIVQESGNNLQAISPNARTYYDESSDANFHFKTPVRNRDFYRPVPSVREESKTVCWELCRSLRINKAMRAVLGRGSRDRTRTEELLALTGQPSVLEIILRAVMRAAKLHLGRDKNEAPSCMAEGRIRLTQDVRATRCNVQRILPPQHWSPPWRPCGT